jgi:hypothetical protein
MNTDSTVKLQSVGCESTPQQKNKEEKGTQMPIGTSESSIIEVKSPDGVKERKIAKLASKFTSPATWTTQNVASSEIKRGSVARLTEKFSKQELLPSKHIVRENITSKTMAVRPSINESSTGMKYPKQIGMAKSTTKDKVARQSAGMKEADEEKPSKSSISKINE